MLTSWPVALAVSVLLGFLTGLGVGGGSLLILWLTMAAGLAQQTARGINLIFFLPSAIIAGFFRWKAGDVDWKAILPAIGAGCAAAAGFSWLGSHMDLSLLRKLFGALLLITGLRELLYRPKNHNANKDGC